MKNLKGRRPSGSMIVAIVALVAALGGTAYAASKITTKDIKRGAVTSAKVDNGTLKSKDFSKKARNGLKGKRGPKGRRGKKGAQGPKGDTGAAGPAGQTLVAQRLTPPNPAFSNVGVVEAEALPLGSGGPTQTDGEELFPSVNLDQGKYRIEGTVQFFDFNGGPTAGSEYGVARVFLGGVKQATLWSGDVPDDGNNAAQTNGSMILDVPSGGATLSVRAAVRTAEGNDGGQAGGNLIVTSIG